jgi:hypothetical protein
VSSPERRIIRRPSTITIVTVLSAALTSKLAAD